MKIIITIIFMLSSSALSTGLIGQSRMTLEEAYKMTEANFPNLRSIDIYRAIQEAENRLIDQSRLPMVALKGAASLQSEAISLGSDAPGSPISINLPLYSIKTYGEATYNLYDGGLINMRKRINEINTLVREQEIQVDLYPLREQVNQVFSGVALAKRLIGIYDLTYSDIEIRQEILQKGIDLGTILESEVTKLEVRKLEVENEKGMVQADIYSAYATLSVLTGTDIESTTLLAMPQDLESKILSEVHRPEIQLFARKKYSILAQKELIDVADKPNLILFGQAGLSYPNALNFSKVQLAPYAIGGIRFSYKIFDKSDKDIRKQRIDLESELIDIQEATFRQQIKLKGSRYAEEFKALQDQIIRFEKIAVLQAEILNQLAIQIDNGVITSTEYLLQSNAELRARQNLEVSMARLDQKRLEYITINGNDGLFSQL